MQQQDIKPAYEVEALEGTQEVTLTKLVDGVITQTVEEVPLGWMVYFPAGHSIRVRTIEELHRMGFDAPPDLLDMESGETVALSNTSLKENTRRKTRSRKKSSATGGITKDG